MGGNSRTPCIGLPCTWDRPLPDPVKKHDIVKKICSHTLRRGLFECVWQLNTPKVLLLLNMLHPTDRTGLRSCTENPAVLFYRNVSKDMVARGLSLVLLVLTAWSREV